MPERYAAFGAENDVIFAMVGWCAVSELKWHRGAAKWNSSGRF